MPGRGFAGLTPEKQREIAAAGGRASHAKGVAHEFTSEEAAAAGKIGGKSHSREHLAEIGARGGKARGRKKKAAE
jgi:general stress protein YciG